MFDSLSLTKDNSVEVRREARRILLVGEVQGVGLRPALVQLAEQCALRGWVRNVSTHVEVVVEGESKQVETFFCNLRNPIMLPGQASISEAYSVAPQNYEDFRILESDIAVSGPAGDVPLDRVTCGTCRQEFSDPLNRRRGYGLIGCSSCGPRFSILRAMPFDRDSTAMASFACCPACLREYENAKDRRYHSQTNACLECGPQVWGGRESVEALRRHEVIALRGVGGYQWIAFAGSEKAVQYLRNLKGRARKPFAVMMSEKQIGEWILDKGLVERISRPDGSIVIVPANAVHKELSQLLSPSVRTEVQSLGVMMPTSMLHDELVSQVGPLVVTSANVEGEPMYIDEAALVGRKGEADGMPLQIIDHNRPIVQRIDDSVVMAMGTRYATIRPARGLTPCSWDLVTAGFIRPQASTTVHVLALGSQQKACLAWSDGQRLTLGPYIGDMNSVSMQEAAIEQWAHLQSLYRFEPEIVAHDFHPDFFTTQWAKEVEAKSRVHRIAVQHHRAHWLASLLEPGWLDRSVIGIVWDGTGLGDDGAIWGSECFVGNRFSHDRVACLLPFALPGGEAAIREPWRVAVSLLSHVNPAFATHHFDGLPVGGIEKMVADNLNIVSSSSMGRLFDAVAAIILEPAIGQREVSYEGELAQLLEERCDIGELESYGLPLLDDNSKDRLVPRYWDWRPMMARIVEEKQANVPIRKMAMRFHRSLAGAISDLMKNYPDLPLSVSGGCFQNRILVQLLQETEMDRKRSVAWPGLVPVNDSGIAIGQTLATLAWHDTISQRDQGSGVPKLCV